MARLSEDTFSRGFETARILLTNPRFSTTLAAAIRRPGGVDRAIDALRKEFELEIKETPSQQTAREIMSSNMLGILEVEYYFCELTDEQRAALEIIPFSEETLKACAKTHVLVADIGLSIIDVRGRMKRSLFYEQKWFDNEEFAKRTETARWRLIRKHSVEGSLSKNWSEQQRLVNTETDEIPSARQVVYTMILHFLVTGERLFETCYVRTSDVDSDGDTSGFAPVVTPMGGVVSDGDTSDVDSNGAHVHVGNFYEDGLSVYRWHDSGRNDNLGLISARQS